MNNKNIGTMKSLKTITYVTILLFLGMSSSYGQKKSTVIISGKTITQAKYQIEIVKPDYVVERKDLHEKTDPFLAALKKEMDVWLNQGYKLTDVTSSTLGTTGENVMFVLIKEE
jgi:hypothetical protein